MLRERLGRVTRAVLLVAVGVQGLASPVSGVAVGGSIPDCVEASPLAAWAGVTTHVMATSTDCPHGSYAPASSYQSFAHLVLTASVTATLLGFVALLAAVGLGVHLQRTVRSLRRWFVHRFRVAAAGLQLVMPPKPSLVLVTCSARPSRVVSGPHVRRGPPSSDR
ncbi:MAG: hypothetical protein ACOH16_04055 [Propionibacteriaceae bacterium]